MTLIVYYVVFMIVGDFAAYFLGLFTEYEWGSQVSLIVFLVLYFFFYGCLGCWLCGSPSQKRQSSNHFDHEELLAENHKWLSCRVMRSSKSLAG